MLLSGQLSTLLRADESIPLYMVLLCLTCGLLVRWQLHVVSIVSPSSLKLASDDSSQGGVHVPHWRPKHHLSKRLIRNPLFLPAESG